MRINAGSGQNVLRKLRRTDRITDKGNESPRILQKSCGLPRMRQLEDRYSLINATRMDWHLIREEKAA